MLRWMRLRQHSCARMLSTEGNSRNISSSVPVSIAISKLRPSLLSPRYLSVTTNPRKMTLHYRFGYVHIKYKGFPESFIHSELFKKLSKIIYKNIIKLCTHAHIDILTLQVKKKMKNYTILGKETFQESTLHKRLLSTVSFINLFPNVKPIFTKMFSIFELAAHRWWQIEM